MAKCLVLIVYVIWSVNRINKKTLVNPLQQGCMKTNFPVYRWFSFLCTVSFLYTVLYTVTISCILCPEVVFTLHFFKEALQCDPPIANVLLL